MIGAIFCENSFIGYSILICSAAFTTLLIFGSLGFTVCIYRSGKKEAEGLKWYQCCRDGDKTFTSKRLNIQEDIPNL